MSNFSCRLNSNITQHSMGSLAFHSFLRWKMIILPILTTSLIVNSLKGWENVLFELGSERVNLHDVRTTRGISYSNARVVMNLTICASPTYLIVDLSRFLVLGCPQRATTTASPTTVITGQTKPMTQSKETTEKRTKTRIPTAKPTPRKPTTSSESSVAQLTAAAESVKLGSSILVLSLYTALRVLSWEREMESRNRCAVRRMTKTSPKDAPVRHPDRWGWHDTMKSFNSHSKEEVGSKRMRTHVPHWWLFIWVEIVGDTGD